MPKKLADKVAIVTGATRGIGKGIAKVFAEEGAKLVVTGRNEETLATTIKELTQLTESPDQILGVVTDISKLPDIKNLITSTLTQFGRIDILCQNAGIFPEKKIEDMSEENWDEVQNTNLKGTAFTVMACLKIMKEQQYGRIVVTSSITGPRTGIPGLSHYGASKAGINGFIRGAALEFAPHNITINAIEPGNILTEGLQALGPEYLRTMTEAIPLGRLGSPEDVGRAALYLASDDAAFITGQSLIVDGGQTIPESRQAILARPEQKQSTARALSVLAIETTKPVQEDRVPSKEKIPASSVSSWRKNAIAFGASVIGLGALCLLKQAVSSRGSSMNPNSQPESRLTFSSARSE